MTTMTDAEKKDAAGVAIRADDWANTLEGWGTDSDPSIWTDFSESLRLPDATLRNLWRDWLAKKIIKSLPEDALSKGIGVNVPGDAGVAGNIVTRMDELDVAGTLLAARCWERLFGGCVVWLGVEEEGARGADSIRALETPLDIEKVRGLRFLKVIDKTYLAPVWGAESTEYGSLGEAQLFDVTRMPGDVRGLSPQRLRIHRSRLLVLDGQLTPDQTRDGNEGWGDSVLQSLWPVLQGNGGMWKAASRMLRTSSYMKAGLAAMREQLAAPGGEERVKQRLRMMRQSMSQNGVVAHDVDDVVGRDELSMGGVPNVMSLFLMQVAAAADMPVTRLWGRSAEGMNATGDGDRDVWFGQVAVERRDLEPFVNAIVEIIARGMGKNLPEWSVEWSELRPMSDLERADRLLKVTQAAALLVREEIMPPEAVAIAMWPEDGDGLSDNLGSELDGDLRESMRAIMELDMERAEETAENPPEPPPGPGSPEVAGDEMDERETAGDLA